ncbi:MAG: hypothetical protein FWF95_05790 [Syntrophorhabdaceae bacterium]|nr:hypothetical protein [Syntrophorhabdaceae bacterium]
MRQHTAALALFISIVCVISALATRHALEAASEDPGIRQVELLIGQDFDMCKSGDIVCPAKLPICDDPNVAVPVDLSSGMGFRGVAKGTTLCSAASAVGPRRVFRITVR